MKIKKTLRVKLNKKQRRMLKAFLLVLGDRVMDVSPYILETLIVFALVGEPDKFFTEEDWKRYMDYCREWYIEPTRKEIANYGKCASKRELIPGSLEVSGLHED